MDGVKVNVGSAQFVVPRLTVGTYKRISKLAASVNDENGADVLLEQMVLALKANYPDLTAEALADAVYLDELVTIHANVMAAAGQKKGGAEGEAGSP